MFYPGLCRHLQRLVWNFAAVFSWSHGCELYKSTVRIYLFFITGAHVHSHYTRRSDSFSNNTIVSHSGTFIAVKDAAWLDGNIFPETVTMI